MSVKPTTTDVLAAMAHVHGQFGTSTLPDLRTVASILEHVDINSACAKTGLTPLLWTIEHDSPLISFILARGSDVATKGTGDFAKTPVELALEKKLMKRATQLVERGAPCPPEVAERIAEGRRAAAAASQEQAQIEKSLERGLKAPAFVELARRFGDRFGIEPKKIRGRQGHLSFKGVPVRALARDASKSEALWLSGLNIEAASAGGSLFAADPIEEKAKIELCLAPTTTKRHVLTISQLLTGEITSAAERMEHADLLDALARDYPFTLVSCGRWGVFGKPDFLPDDTSALASRLFDICGELLEHYRSEYNHKHKIMPPAPIPHREKLVAALAADLKAEEVIWLPWGVDL